MKKLILLILAACFYIDKAYSLENFCSSLKLIDLHKSRIENMEFKLTEENLKNQDVVQQMYRSYYKVYREALLASQTNNLKSFYDILGKCKLSIEFYHRDLLTSDIQLKNMIPEAHYAQILKHISEEDLFDSTKYTISALSFAGGAFIYIAPIVLSAGAIIVPTIIIGHGMMLLSSLYLAVNMVVDTYLEFKYFMIDEANLANLEQAAHEMASKSIASLLKWDERKLNWNDKQISINSILR